MDEIKKITINDDNYPSLLKKIPNPPGILYYRGILKSDEPCFAIVGTRQHSPYGRQTTLKISKNLSDSGLTIVSGLAPGIDTFSHETVVKNNKRTIAVLGTGLDENSIYPSQNIVLSRKIVETGGCLISEYPPGTKGTRFTFPQRNRIISGLSIGTLVIEAKQRSGSLITANYAFSHRRKVFAVPGSIYCQNSQGPHDLIKKGAKLVNDASDILKELNLMNLTSFEKKEIIIETSEENLILNVLEREPLSLDKIIEKTKLNAFITKTLLMILEAKGKIKHLGDNNYIKI